MSPGETFEATTVHATCIVLQEAGLLIRGEAGSGKTSLALALMDRAASAGLHAGLVGDDRIRLEARHRRLVARGHPAVAGLVEIREHGIRRAVEVHGAAVVRLVIDLAADGPRLPEAAEETVSILGIGLPRLTLDRTLLERGLAVRIVLDSLLAMPGCVAARTHSPILAPGVAHDL